MFVGLIIHWVFSSRDKYQFQDLIKLILPIHDYYYTLELLLLNYYYIIIIIKLLLLYTRIKVKKIYAYIHKNV